LLLLQRIILHNMEETSNHNTWHERCQLWVEPFSLYISHFFPMEYIYGHWFQYIKTEDCKIKMFSPHLPIHWQIPCGSRMEGVFIPEVHKIRVIFIISFSAMLYFNPCWVLLWYNWLLYNLKALAACGTCRLILEEGVRKGGRKGEIK